MVVSLSSAFPSDSLLQAAHMEDAVAMVTVITYTLGRHVLNLRIPQTHLPWLPFQRTETVSPQGICI